MASTGLEPPAFSAFQSTQDKDWFDTDIDKDYSFMFGPQMSDYSMNATFFDPVEALPSTYGALQSQDAGPTAQSNNMLAYQRLPSSSSADGADGLFTLDNFSTVSSADTLQLSKLASTVSRACSAMESIPSMLEKLSNSIDRISTGFERFSGSLNGASTLVERFHSQAENVSEYTTATTGEFEVRVDSLSERIDGLVATVEEIVKRERIAMEKFGNFAGRINQPVDLTQRSSG
ncbi:hypothetical protein BJX65DRAFT_306174 [Aspergillus insuetus]